MTFIRHLNIGSINGLHCTALRGLACVSNEESSVCQAMSIHMLQIVLCEKDIAILSSETALSVYIWKFDHFCL